MASMQSPKAPRMRQARKSIAHMPSTDIVGNKENLTEGSATIGTLDAQVQQQGKKSRSKSIGPGGLDALKEDSGNKQVRLGLRRSLELEADSKEPSLPPYVKSILKPTIALSPPKMIPPHSTARKASPGKANVRRTPEKASRLSPKKSTVSGSQSLSNPFAPSPRLAVGNTLSPSRSPTRVAVRTEEEQQAAAKERERQEAMAHKDARRKSLGETPMPLDLSRL